MRRDHEYVDKATAMLLCTTAAGDRALALARREAEEIHQPLCTRAKALSLLQDHYFILPPRKAPWTMSDLFEAFLDLYPRCGLIGAEFIGMLIFGWIGVRKVIWD